MGGIICNKTAVCFQQPLSPAASLYGKCHRANRFFISHLRLKTKIVYLWVCWFGFVKSNVGFVWLKNHMSFLLYLRSKKHGFFVGAFAIILSLCKRRPTLNTMSNVLKISLMAWNKTKRKTLCISARAILKYYCITYWNHTVWKLLKMSYLNFGTFHQFLSF